MANQAAHAVPEGMNSLTTYLWFNGNGLKALDFYQKHFGMRQTRPAITSENQKSLMHVMVEFEGSNLMMADSFNNSNEMGPKDHTTASVWVYTNDCDALYKTAIEAGCISLMELTDTFWGDRMGKLKDPFGHCWTIATHKTDLSKEELAKGKAEWLDSMKK